jgi:hypothetical protein
VKVRPIALLLSGELAGRGVFANRPVIAVRLLVARYVVSMAVRRDIKYGADWVKLMATGGVMDPMS